MSLKGFLFPRTHTGNSSLIPNVPWHYSGDLLTLEYRTNPERVAELLPDGIELADEDPGAVAVIWADWQSCSDNFNELLDPVRAQYKEVFFVVRCKYQGKIYSRCIYIWVDKDFSAARGQFQGYPKKNWFYPFNKVNYCRKSWTSTSAWGYFWSHFGSL